MAQGPLPTGGAVELPTAEEVEQATYEELHPSLGRAYLRALYDLVAEGTQAKEELKRIRETGVIT